MSIAKRIATPLLAAMGFLTLVALLSPPPVRAQNIPSDPEPTCTTATPNLSASANFNSWFQSGTVTLNGVVNPADKIGRAHV